MTTNAILDSDSLQSTADARIVASPKHAGSPQHEELPAPRRAPWAWAGLASGVLGFAATMFLGPQSSTEEETAGGAEQVFSVLHDRVIVQVGASLGFLATAVMVLFAVGYTRWLEAKLPSRSLVPAAVRLSLTASVAAFIVSFGFKAMLAGGMPGGVDAAMYTKTDVAALLIITGQIQWLAWMGVAFAGALTTFAVFKHRILPVWIAWLGVLCTAFVSVMTLAIALPYSAGVVTPPYVILLSLTLLLSKKAQRA